MIRNDARHDAYPRRDNRTPPREASPIPSPRPPVLEDDFPTLGNAPPPYVPAVLKKPAERGEDFPTLSSARGGAAAVTTSSLVPGASSSRLIQSKPGNNGPRPGAHRPATLNKPSNNSPTIAATATSAEASQLRGRLNGVQISPVRSSRPTMAPAGTNTWSAPRLASGEDFPTLGGNKKNKGAKGGPNYPTFGAWSQQQNSDSRRPDSGIGGGRQQPPPQSYHNPTSLAALGRTLCDDGEFPTLGGGGGPSFLPGSWIQNNKNKNVNSKALGKTRDAGMSNGKSKLEGPPWLVVDGMSDDTTEETVSKKKKRKQKEQDSDMKAATGNSGITLSSIASEFDALSVMPEPKPKTTKKTTEEPKKPDALVLSSFSDNSAVNEPTSYSSEPKAPVAPSASEPGGSEGKENQKWGTVGPRKSKAFSHHEEDFPTLKAEPKKTLPSPPPGFRTPAKVAAAPPPGLKQPALSWAQDPPPGLGSTAPYSSYASPPLQHTQTVSSPSSSNDKGTSIPMAVKLNLYPFVFPPDASERNGALVKRVRQLLEERKSGGGGFDKFRALSIEFRLGGFSAQAYYRECQELLGRDSFVGVLAELVALLPNILRQHELMKAYRQERSDDLELIDLQACPTCHQLLKVSDLPAHQGSHPCQTASFNVAHLITLMES